MAHYPAGGVEQTALGVAFIRAEESRRAGRLFDDPFAALFVTAAERAGRTVALMNRQPGLDNWLVVRTRFFDDLIEREAEGGCDQFVVLGAGLDSRAFRLGVPAAASWYEVDSAAVLDFKRHVLSENAVESACRCVPVAGDLRQGWLDQLALNGFDPSRRTTWLAEGLLVYLTTGEIHRLMTEISAASPPLSRLGLTLSAPGRLDRRKADAAMRGEPTLWESDGPRVPATWLARDGWSPGLYEIDGRGYVEVRTGPDQERDRPTLVAASRSR